MGDERQVRIIINTIIERKRRVGRPGTRWKDVLARDLDAGADISLGKSVSSGEGAPIINGTYVVVMEGSSSCTCTGDRPRYQRY